MEPWLKEIDERLEHHLRPFHDILQLIATEVRVIRHHQAENQKELLMSGQTLSQQLDAAIAAIQADVAAVSAEVSKLLSEVVPGSTITQAQVDALTAIDTSLKAIPPAP